LAHSRALALTLHSRQNGLRARRGQSPCTQRCLPI
jgi:hypothetical protein